MTLSRRSSIKLGMTKDEYLEKLYRFPLSVEWTTGGAEGGNCWGDEAREFRNYDEEPEFNSLTDILQEFCPNITLKEFKMIENDGKVLTHRSWTDSEYYGNYYEREGYFIDEDALWTYVEVLTNITDPAVRASHFALMKD